MNAHSDEHPISATTRHIIDQLFAHGLSRGHAYPIEFALFGDRAALDRLRDHLVKSGFKEDADQSTEMLVAVKDTRLDYDTIGDALAEMKELANKFNVGFDGWSCSVV
jgi:regulator of RNase E activity RraB